MYSPRQIHRAFTATALLCLASAPLAGAEPPRPGWKLSGSAGLELSYDTNVMLQSVSDLAEIESWVAALSASLSADWTGEAGATARINYAPTWTRFDRASSEDFLAHRLSASLNGTTLGARYALSANTMVIDGSDRSVIWTGPGGAPATGGATVRDRRDETVYRAAARAEWALQAWFIRPVGTLYIADFQTVHESTAGCLNHVDRNDLNAGLDLGRTLKSGLSAYLGYRAGAQDQARLLAYGEEYDNTYDRFLAGMDGKPFAWLTLAVAAGPEFRTYARTVHANFPDRTMTNTFYDGTATIAATRQDAFILQARQFQQLASGGRGAFNDRTFAVTWRRTFSPSLNTVASIQGYNTRFLAPARRDDWIYSARVSATYKVNETWTLEATCAYEEGVSDLPNLPGREYERTVTSLAARVKL